MGWTQVGHDVFRWEDTCHVYLLRHGDEAVLVDFGSGRVLDHLVEVGVARVTDILVTHHHRDQVQGLALASARGIGIWVPPTERHLIDDVDEHWRTRPLDNDYDVRQDRFSLLWQVPVTGTVPEYRTRRFGAFDITTLPLPGHTPGSVGYLVETCGRRLAFTGDLIHGDGRVWSLAATQWAYTGFHPNAGLEGVAATVLSCALLLRERVDLLLPSHGEPVTDPEGAVARLTPLLRELIDSRRRTPWDPEALLERPWEPVTPHLLRNTTSVAQSYALLSDQGGALLLDFGYDLTTGLPGGHDRSARRPLLASVEALRRQYGVDRVEVALPTHYHDDHVAGFNLLRAVHGTEVWSPAHIAEVLSVPTDWDLPCLWYEPIPVDRVLPREGAFRWREYEIGVHDLPGHTLYASAYSMDVDGRRIVASGDQQNTAWDPVRGEVEILNYQYRNRFRIDDFARSADLYRRLRPDVLISGHWPPHEVTEAYLDMLASEGERLARLHRELLPAGFDLEAEGLGARLTPYRSVRAPGDTLRVTVEARNPLPHAEVVRLVPVLPRGWSAEPPFREVKAGAGESVTETFAVRIPADERSTERQRVGVDMSVGQVALGQQAEALVSVR
ncbi:MBL fold metallo-hydrolase [Streptomyces sp. NPDC059861]|uniref:MBL fold metallo-hydrolase n=1 Tax=Streptomyces sp. NPDC059861 TaxID=3346974 RepID=UPI00365B49F8